MSRLHHVCIATDAFEWYVDFFKEVFEMTVERTATAAPERVLWFNEGIQIKELTERETAGTGVDHISIETEDIPETVKRAIRKGCTPLAQGGHWFAFPNGVKIELK